MAVNNRLLVFAGSIVGGLGTQKTLLHILYPPKCIEAIERTSQLEIAIFCPEGFNDFALINVIGLGVGLAIIGFFGKDILQAIWDFFNTSRDPAAR